MRGRRARVLHCVLSGPECAQPPPPAASGQLSEEAALVSWSFWAWTCSRLMRLARRMSEAWIGTNVAHLHFQEMDSREKPALDEQELRSQVSTPDPRHGSAVLVGGSRPSPGQHPLPDSDPA